MSDAGQNVVAVSTSELEIIHGHGEMVLLVDDDMAITETGREVLETLGYQVQQANNSQQTIDLYSKHGGTIDLIIMDVVMPVIGGDKAAQHIRELNPAVKIIFQPVMITTANTACAVKPCSINLFHYLD